MIYVYIIIAYFRNIIFSITYSWQLEKVVLFKLTEIKGILQILYIYIFFFIITEFFFPAQSIHQWNRNTKFNQIIRQFMWLN